MKKATFILVLLTCMLLIGCNIGNSSNNIKNDKKNISNKSKQVDKVTSKKFKELSNNKSQEDKSKEQDKWDVSSYESLDDIIHINKLKIVQEDIVAADVEAYEIKYKSDEFEIIAFLALPTSSIQSKTPTPCIIYNRDGYGDVGTNASTTIIDLASYFNAAVFATQYRGNTTSTGADAFGGADINDVIKLVDLCHQFQFIDTNRIYMTGVGRGGMMTYMAANRDKRIKKIAVKGGMADLFITADFRPDLHQVFRDFVGGIPAELPTEFQARSATYWAGCISCPVLIMHGRYDYKVSYSEATKMAQCLADCGVPYEFVTNENEVNSYQLSDFNHIKAWFELM